MVPPTGPANSCPGGKPTRGGNRGGNNSRGGNAAGGGQNVINGNRGRGRGNGGNQNRGGNPGGNGQGRSVYRGGRGGGGNIGGLKEQPDNGNGHSSNGPANQRTSHKYERKGPVFGFKRLNDLLTVPPNEAILSIDSDIKDWRELMQSEDLTSKSDTLLVLAVRILAGKICCETTLSKGQMDILTAASVTNFISKINHKCSQILIGMDGASSLDGRLKRLTVGNFVEVDTSTKTFLTSLHKYCSFVAKILPNLAVDYLLAVVASAYGAVLTRSASDSSFTPLVQLFEELKNEIQSLVKEKVEKAKPVFRKQGFGFTLQEEQELHAMEAPDDFRKMNIIPTPEELLSRDEVFLRPNKTSGAYADADHYLDTQFRLQREDFVQPLRKGVQDFMKHRFEYLSKKKKMPLGTIRIYPGVQIISGELVKEMFVFKVQLMEDNYRRVKWERSKRLLTGSLLVFTSDLFKTAYFATVAYRNEAELSRGVLSLVWEGITPTWDTDDEYLMVECEVYFEPFRHTLQTLQSLQLQDFPMCKFIVEASSDVGPPVYIQESEYMMKLKLANHEDLLISPLIPEQWPTHEALGLDVNQFVAFQAALTKEFAIIQGPPGTGKTFLGLKIANVFLRNQKIWDGSPILVVCYTNHALDQFLEGILDIFKKLGKQPSLVRVGSRSKSDKLTNFSLSEVVHQYYKNKKMPRHYNPDRSEIISGINELKHQRSSAMAALMGLRDIEGIVNFEQIDSEVKVWEKLNVDYPKTLFRALANKKWLGVADNTFKKFHNPEDIVRRFLQLVIRPFSKGIVKKVAPTAPEAADPATKPKDSSNEDFEEHYDLDELLEHRIVDEDLHMYLQKSKDSGNKMGKHLPCIPGFSISECEKHIRRCDMMTKKLQDEEPDPVKMQHKMMDYAAQKAFAKKIRNFLDTLFSLYKSGRIDLPDVTPVMTEIKTADVPLIWDKLWKLKMPQRWAVFFEIVDRARVLSAKRAAEIDEQLIYQQKKLQEIEAYGKGYILQQSKVVGMTTTGAAKYHHLVKMMKSKIVIVEEAAEVLESHIVTSLTNKCEHLILIGDHRQLRPSTTVYELAKKYNLDISLFERMINNKLNCYQLKVQHRMRPEIANLVLGTIYEELLNAPSVNHYPPVLGVTRNLFFLSHNELEKSEADSMSKSNEFEAKLLAVLCRYLILQGYTTDQITVLTTYTGQMFLLKNVFGKLSNCKGVRITVVDNFQGEENDIILLSLVRSNADSKIGFLSIENRICVALSRARHGLYIVGNMKMLASKSPTWTQIEEKLNQRGECGPFLQLECQIHHTLSEVSNEADFIQKVPEGGCILMCDTVLECTHKCLQVCHIADRDHKVYQCKEPCLKRCADDHQCARLCYLICPPCPVQVRRTLLCLHEKTMACYKDIGEVLCYEQVVKKLTCGHEHQMACHRDPAEFKCNVEVEKELPCGHSKVLKCHEDPSEANCKILMVKKLIPCGHEQEAECRFLPEVIKCKTLVPKKFEICEHEMDVPCGDADKKLNCKNQCRGRLRCGHMCTKICHVSEDPEHLNYKCNKECHKECQEGHQCTSMHKCHLPCPPCKIKVERKLPCNHNFKLYCHLDPEKYECLKPCEKTLPMCGHKWRSLCHQPCGDCQIPLEKRIPECRHTIIVACSVTPTKSMCKELVRPDNQSACKHDTLVPCGVSNIASHSQVMAYCTHPCEDPFSETEGGCGHKCKGTCKSCLQGKFHEKCQEKCGKALFCGHVCEVPCSKGCPPCGMQCLMKCEHSECRNKCGTPCQDCCEKCPWQCPHKQCTKLCGEMCDREPCDEPCSEMLKCGHPCIGFCGEPCPLQCRICDRKEITEFQLYCNEEDEDSRFVFLPDCKHAIEVEGLKYHMNLNEGEIGIKRCPRCHTPIRYCRRFGNAIRARLQDIIKVKKMIFGNLRKIKNSQNILVTSLKLEDNRWTRVFPVLHGQLLKKLVNQTQVKVKRGNTETRIVHKQVDEMTLESLNLIAGYGETAITVLLKAKTDLRPELALDLGDRYRDLFALAMARPLPLSRLEVRDIGQELDRLHDLYQLYLRRSNPRFTDGHPVASPIYLRLLEIVLTPFPYTDKSSRGLLDLFRELEETLRTGLGVSEKVKREIMAATGMPRGRWYKCPNGHFYVIGNCGEARQEAKCGECNALIGGSMGLRRDNTGATEMD